MNKKSTCFIFFFFFSISIFSQAPVITRQPSNQGVIEGQTALFSVDVTGDTLSYQWYKDGTAIGGAIDSVYTTPTTVLADNGSLYSVKVTNSSGSDFSEVATLYVTATEERVAASEIASYNFNEGEGNIIHDNSGASPAVNLTIKDTNNVIWSPNGLRVVSPTEIQSSLNPQKFIDSCMKTNELTIEAWIVPHDTLQNDAHIITLQAYGDYRRFSLIQNRRNYTAKVRILPSTNLFGEPFIRTYNGDVKLNLTQVVYTRSSNGKVTIYLNGSEIFSDSLPGDFSSWPGATYLFGLASSYPGRYWLGTFYYTGIYNRALSSAEISHNYSIGVSIDTNPYISKQPKDAFSVVGGTASFSVEAVSSTLLSYQWQKNGVNIPGATNSSYTTDTLEQSDDNSTYRVIVSNASGSDTSNIATLYITPDEERVAFGLQALYDFKETSGTVVHDVSNVGSPLNLNINTPSVTLWTLYTLKTTGPALVNTDDAATKLYNSFTSSHELTLEAWVKPADYEEDAKIVTISQNSSDLNFSLTQNGDSFEGILRTSETNNAGNTLSTPSGVTKLTLTHVVFTRNSKGTVKIYIDGEETATGSISGNFSTWNSTFKLAFFNEITGDQGWLGNLNLVAFFDRALNSQEIVHNFEFGARVPVIDPPRELIAENFTSKEVLLTWTDNSYNEENFVIERKIEGPITSAFEALDTVGMNITSYIDTLIIDTTTYTYRVKAGGWLSSSLYSNEASVKTLLSTIATPTELTAMKDNPDTNNVKLAWVDNSTNELGFIIQRKLGDTSSTEPYSDIDTVDADMITFTDSTVSDTTTYTYRVYAYNADTVSAFSNLAEITTPLPVELTSFTANMINGNVIIHWITSSEINNTGFSLQRSSDNQSFTEITFIKGKGTTTDVTEYSYKDKSVLSGKYYYRLKQVDFNGSFYYSNSIEIDLGIPKNFALDQNYPNPFNPTTTIRFALPIDAKVNIKLFNTLGQEVATILNNELDAGVHEINYNASDFSSGVYFYRLNVQSANGSQYISTKRMILMK